MGVSESGPGAGPSYTATKQPAAADSSALHEIRVPAAKESTYQWGVRSVKRFLNWLFSRGVKQEPTSTGDKSLPSYTVTREMGEPFSPHAGGVSQPEAGSVDSVPVRDLIAGRGIPLSDLEKLKINADATIPKNRQKHFTTEFIQAMIIINDYIEESSIPEGFAFKKKISELRQLVEHTASSRLAEVSDDNYKNWTGSIGKYTKKFIEEKKETTESWHKFLFKKAGKHVTVPEQVDTTQLKPEVQEFFKALPPAPKSKSRHITEPAHVELLYDISRYDEIVLRDGKKEEKSTMIKFMVRLYHATRDKKLDQLGKKEYTGMIDVLNCLMKPEYAELRQQIKKRKMNLELAYPYSQAARDARDARDARATKNAMDTAAARAARDAADAKDQ